MPFVPNPPWSNQLIAENMDEIIGSGLPFPNMDELGKGHYGAIYSTSDPDVVFKVTSDDTEAQFIKAATPLGWPEGIVVYRAIIDFEGKFRGRETFGIWREAAFPVGLQRPHRITSNDDQYLKKFWWELQHFKDNATIVRASLQRKPGMMDEVRSRDAWAHSIVTWDTAMPKSMETIHRQRQALYHKGVDRAAVALKACEVIAMAMETSSYFGHSVGCALGYYLDNGMLLADVHANNVGIVHRDGEPYWVITDPGHAVFLNEF
jgi:hypothetical protein